MSKKAYHYVKNSNTREDIITGKNKTFNIYVVIYI